MVEGVDGPCSAKTNEAHEHERVTNFDAGQLPRTLGLRWKEIVVASRF